MEIGLTFAEYVGIFLVIFAIVWFFVYLSKKECMYWCRFNSRNSNSQGSQNRNQNEPVENSQVLNTVTENIPLEENNDNNNRNVNANEPPSYEDVMKIQNS